MHSRAELIGSLKGFKNRRDAALFEDEAAFIHNLERLLDFMDADPVIGTVLDAHIASELSQDISEWWKRVEAGTLSFPKVPDQELALRIRVARDVVENEGKLWTFGFRKGKDNRTDRVNYFRSVLLRPLLDELTDHLSEMAGIPGPEARALQAVPLDRIPRADEVRIFLSHKSVDKPLVYRFSHALQEVGFSPWLDEEVMPAGTNLERGILKGFQDSCAAVFFITSNFKDEKYLAAEVDYAVQQKRKKGEKFAIITLRFEGAAPVPDLLTPYIYKDVSNDLDAFRELVRALPIESGPIRWKAEVVE